MFKLGPALLSYICAQVMLDSNGQTADRWRVSHTWGQEATERAQVTGSSKDEATVPYPRTSLLSFPLVIFKEHCQS